LLSKYFSKANEKINNEKIEINSDGISVKREKKIIYFLFAMEPRTFILLLIEFKISLNIIIKKNKSRDIFVNKR
jgi:hypothetical protein